MIAGRRLFWRRAAAALLLWSRYLPVHGCLHWKGQRMNSHAHKIVIIGGGAGGLELAAKLGPRCGPERLFLVDKSSDHIWKPSLHEVAAGTLDIHREGLSYAMLARDRGFSFMHAEVAHIDRATRLVHLEPVMFEQREILPRRELAYDTLVLAVGSKSNYFGTPGAREFAMPLDSTEQAERFRQRLLRELVIADRNQSVRPDHVLNIAIVGGGATGVELAAELVDACKSMGSTG